MLWLKEIGKDKELRFRKYSNKLLITNRNNKVRTIKLLRVCSVPPTTYNLAQRVPDFNSNITDSAASETH